VNCTVRSFVLDVNILKVSRKNDGFKAILLSRTLPWLHSPEEEVVISAEICLAICKSLFKIRASVVYWGGGNSCR
jgi:hypothetical protein